MDFRIYQKRCLKIIVNYAKRIIQEQFLLDALISSFLTNKYLNFRRNCNIYYHIYCLIKEFGI